MQVFDKVKPVAINDHFRQYMEGLTAKVFRTFNASTNLCSELKKTADEVREKGKHMKGGH